jgi:FixJ family two-component response regulator
MKGTEVAPKIALIDDDAAVRAALERLLLSMQYAVQSYPSAEEFLARGTQQVDCLLLDVQLRGMSGIELIVQLGSIRPELAVILLTANPEEVAHHASAAQLARAVLHKPVDAAVLRVALESALAVAAS